MVILIRLSHKLSYIFLQISIIKLNNQRDLS